MSNPTRNGTRGSRGPATLLISAACVASILIFPYNGDQERGAPASGAVRRPPVTRLATAGGPAQTAGVTDADGVQRRLGHVQGAAIALTFDDGPDPRWTPAVLDLLRRFHVQATFCLVGVHVAEHPELVRQIAAAGHRLCDHTWTHDGALTQRSAAIVRAELTRTYDAIVAAAAVRPRYFRAPGGAWNRVIVAEAGRLALRPLGWSVDPRDWTRPPAAEITRRVLGNATAGSIVLLHDGYGDRSATVTALRTILPTLVARHLTFTTP
jgi:peptidoglycan/xylan/chitin deacetylase (PgdA/CDA1 family)